MTKVLLTESSLANIGNAIRGKNGQATRYKPDEMAAAIDALETVNLEALSVTQNGNYSPTSPKNGFSSVAVAVPNTYGAGDEGKVVSNGALVSQTSKNITSNGTHNTTTNNEVVVNVQPTLQSKTATENGTVTPDQGYDGLSQVVVNVMGGPQCVICDTFGSNDTLTQGIDAELAAKSKKLLVLVLNGDTDNKTLLQGFGVTVNGSALTAEYTDTHQYSSSGDNRRNYALAVYDVSLSAGDSLSMGSTTTHDHTSYAFALISDDFEISKIMTSVDAATSGSNSADGCALYGTFNDASGGTITGAGYPSGTMITTDNPGSGYKSSFIIWIVEKGPTLITKAITQNGTYNASSDNADGYSSVTVNVSGGGGGGIINGSGFTTVQNDLSDINGLNNAVLGYGYTQNEDVTVYLVISATSYRYPNRILALRYSGSTGNEPMFFVFNGSGIIGYTTFNNDVSIPNTYVSAKHVYAISINGTTKKARFYLDGVFLEEKSFNNAANLSYGGSDGGSLGDKKFYFMGCVYGVQTDADVIANSQILMTKYEVGV